MFPEQEILLNTISFITIWFFAYAIYNSFKFVFIALWFLWQGSS
jgi:hypothetical protein